MPERLGAEEFAVGFRAFSTSAMVTGMKGRVKLSGGGGMGRGEGLDWVV